MTTSKNNPKNKNIPDCLINQNFRFQGLRNLTEIWYGWNVFMKAVQTSGWSFRRNMYHIVNVPVKESIKAIFPSSWVIVGFCAKTFESL